MNDYRLFLVLVLRPQITVAVTMNYSLPIPVHSDLKYFVVFNVMLNSVLWSKTILHKTKKTHVPGFSPKYLTIWGRNMVTKHTTGEQITGN
jgi:hypothetical protein